MNIWFDGTLVHEKNANVSVLSHALHYGTAAFEGIRFYKTQNGSAVFRLDEHLKRLKYSAKSIGITLPYTLTALQRAILKTIRANKLPEGYIRPIVWYGEGGLGVNPRRSRVHTAIIILPWGKYLAKKIITLKTVSTRKFSPMAFNPNAKIAGPYVNSVRANQEAKNIGYDEALLLDQKGYVAEGSGENIFIVKKNALYTPPQGNILPGITRNAIITLARELGIPVKEKRLTIQECRKADECFLTGTAAEVTPVGKIDKQVMNQNKIGDITYALQALFETITKGRNKKYTKWLTYVPG